MTNAEIFKQIMVNKKDYPDLEQVMSRNDFKEVKKIVGDYNFKVLLGLFNDLSDDQSLNSVFNQFNFISKDWFDRMNPVNIKEMIIPEGLDKNNLSLIPIIRCEKLESIKCDAPDLPNRIFCDNKSLKKIILTDCEIIPSNSFVNNPVLSDVYLPANVKQIQYGAFRGCPSVKIHIKRGQSIDVSTPDLAFIKEHVIWEN